MSLYLYPSNITANRFPVPLLTNCRRKLNYALLYVGDDSEALLCLHVFFIVFHVGQLREVTNKLHNAELKLFLEIELGPICGKALVKAVGKPLDILSKLNEMARFPPNNEIDLYEEIKFEPNVMCEHIEKKLNFRPSQLEDSDIICYQKSPVPDSEDQYRYPDVPSLLEYVHNRQVVKRCMRKTTRRRNI